MAPPEPKATRTSLLRAQVSRERRAKEQNSTSLKNVRPPLAKKRSTEEDLRSHTTKRSLTCVATFQLEVKPEKQPPRLVVFGSLPINQKRRRPKVIHRCHKGRVNHIIRPKTKQGDIQTPAPVVNYSTVSPLVTNENDEPNNSENVVHTQHKTPLASITPVRIKPIDRLTPLPGRDRRTSVYSPSSRGRTSVSIWSSRRGDHASSRRNHTRSMMSASRPFDRYRHLDLWRALKRGSPEGIARAIVVGQADPNEYFTIPGNWILPWQFTAPVLLSLLNPMSGTICDMSEAVSLGTAAARLASQPIGQLLGQTGGTRFLQIHPTHGSVLFAGRKELSTLVQHGSSVDALDWAGRSALHVLLETPPVPPCSVAGCFNYRSELGDWSFGGKELIVNRDDAQCSCCAAFLAAFLYEVDQINNSLSLGQTLLATHICLSHQDAVKRTPVDLAAQWVRQHRIWRNVTDYVWSYLPPDAETRVFKAIPKELCDLTFVAEDKLRLQALRPLIGISLGLDQPEKLFNIDHWPTNCTPCEPDIDEGASPNVHTPFLATIDENLAGPILFAASPPIGSSVRNGSSRNHQRNSMCGETDSLTPVPVGRVAHLPAPAGTARLAFYRPEDNSSTAVTGSTANQAGAPEETTAVSEFIKFAKENLHHQALTGVWEYLGAQVMFSNNSSSSDKLDN